MPSTNDKALERGIAMLHKKIEGLYPDIRKFVANETIATMRKQLGDGMGKDAALSPDYSTAWRKHREQNGRTASVNLMYTGDMAQSAKANHDSSKVIFTGDTPLDAYRSKAAKKKEKKLIGEYVPLHGAIKNASKALYTHTIRPWIGIGEKSAGEVSNKLAKWLKRNMKRLFARGGA